MIVLVTGATAGFGECIARRFVENGHKVIATGRRHERLQALKDELGENVLTAQLDVRNRAAIEEMMASPPPAVGLMLVATSMARRKPLCASLA